MDRRRIERARYADDMPYYSPISYLKDIWVIQEMFLFNEKPTGSEIESVNFWMPETVPGILILDFCNS
jgi:hypothetical protein